MATLVTPAVLTSSVSMIRERKTKINISSAPADNRWYLKTTKDINPGHREDHSVTDVRGTDDKNISAHLPDDAEQLQELLSTSRRSRRYPFCFHNRKRLYHKRWGLKKKREDKIPSCEGNVVMDKEIPRTISLEKKRCESTRRAPQPSRRRAFR